MKSMGAWFSAVSPSTSVGRSTPTVILEVLRILHQAVLSRSLAGPVSVLWIE